MDPGGIPSPTELWRIRWKSSCCLASRILPASLSQVQFPWYDPCRAMHLAAARIRSSGRILPWTAVCQVGCNRRPGITPGALTVGTLPSRAGTAPGLPGTQFFSNETHLRLPGHMMRSSRRETGQALRRGCPVYTTSSNTRSFLPAAVPRCLPCPLGRIRHLFHSFTVCGNAYFRLNMYVIISYAV